MLSRRTIWSVAITMIVTQLVVRGWLAATGNFYWDDLVLIGRASSNPILSWDYLGHSHDGHFMPAAFLVAGVSTVIAPVNWVVPAVTLVVLQALASLAVWRMIRVLAPRAGIGALAALAFYLFTPMTVPAFAWWAAALNSLPLQAAMAWIVADAVLLVRSGGRRADARMIVIRSAVVFVVALAFFEKSLFILPVAFAAATLSARSGVRGRPDDAAVGSDTDRLDASTEPTETALIRAFTGARTLWVVLGGVFVAWLLVFFSVSDATAGEHSISQTLRLVWRSINNAVVPSFVGGPWEWERWVPSPPMGFAPVWMIVLGWLVLAALVAWAAITRRGALAVVTCAIVYVVAAQIPVMWNRSSANTALELAQTMRYLPDSALVITIAIALIIASPPSSRQAPGRHTGERPERRQAGVLTVALVGALAVASATISLASFSSSWRDDPTGDYLANAKRSLAQHQDHTMFDQALPLEVLLPVAYPNNQISHTFGRLRERPEFGVTTDRLQVLDSSGRMVDGAVTPARTIEPGSGACDRPEITGPSELALSGPLLQWRWTVGVGYCANIPGQIEMALDDGPAQQVTVQAGLHVAYVQLEGRGHGISIRPLTPGLALHTGEGRVGEVAEARLVG